MITINDSLAYLIGLVTGKGYIEDGNKVSIEFPFVNEYVEGIAHCPLCHYLCTQPAGESLLKCKNKNCSNSKTASLNPNLKKRYHQPTEFNSSIKNVIIPFLQEGLNFEFDLVSNSTCTFITLTLEPEVHSFISKLFYPAVSFTSTSVPKEMNGVDENKKIEFLNGLFDSIGFANAGSWIPRDGNNGHGRMRVYFQVINRNYQLPVSIDNYIRDNFNLSIQTIDWGHPNIRDGNLVDYIEGKSSSYGREHQIKFYPEFYTRFKFRISSKNKLFHELLSHNLSVGFTEIEDWFPNSVKEIPVSKIKPTHPMEKSPVLDEKVRTHVDALWQVNLKMGCKYLKGLQDQAANKELFEITGISVEIPNAQEKIKLFKALADKKSSEILTGATRKKKQLPKNNNGLEIDTYPYLVDWLQKHITVETGTESVAFDTSSQTLFQYFSSKSKSDESFIKAINNLETLSIRPDVVGFSNSINELYFIESKITSLGLKELGQIIGYCHVANPKQAYLITTQKLTKSLMIAIKRNRDIICYGLDKEVLLGTLKDGKIELMKNV
jgi:hypothetical protein